jgi:3',5'-cyclic AMP phosphodiesterase CpdA
MLSILHLSDLHFGAAFRFAPAILRPGDPPVLEPFGNLTDPCRLVLSDLERMSEDPDLPLEVRQLASCVDLVVLSGDIANTGGRDRAWPLRGGGPEDEYDQAVDFVKRLLSGIQRQRSEVDAACGRAPELVVVPGNHDVDWVANASPRQRFLGYARFWHALSGSADYLNREPNEIVCYRQVLTEQGIVAVVGFNSCTMSAEQENLRDIGIVENAQLDLADQLLHAATDTPRRKIAVVHHHPICMPPVAAEYTTYDAIAQAGRFLSYLQDRGFDLVLHGHKHYPMVWVHNMRPYEAGRMQNWSDPVIVSGGSLAAESGRLPRGVPNAYHLIGLRVVPDALRPKCVVVRRALPLGELLHGAGFDEDGIWHLGADNPPSATRPTTGRARPWGAGTPDGSERGARYAASDGWMLVHRYRRSREPNQLFDISVHLTAHKKAESGRKKVRAVTYDVGQMWPGSPFLIEDPKNGFELRLSAYGPDP